MEERHSGKAFKKDRAFREHRAGTGREGGAALQRRLRAKSD